MAEGKLKVYSDEEVQARIQADGLEGWTLEDGWLRRKYNTDGWPTTLMLVNAIGYLCEAAWHHADLSVTWGKVWVKLKTHSDGRDHRQGLRPGPEDRGGRSLAARAGRPARGDAEQVCSDQEVRIASRRRSAHRVRRRAEG